MKVKMEVTSVEYLMLAKSISVSTVEIIFGKWVIAAHVQQVNYLAAKHRECVVYISTSMYV